MIIGKTEEETIAITMEALGVSREEALVILAIERGESEGDVVVIESEQQDS